MKTADVGAAAHNAEPTSKIISDDRNTHLIEKTVQSLPNSSWKVHWVSRNAPTYHATSSRALKRSDILGMAVTMIVLSRATRNVDVKRHATIAASLKPAGYSMYAEVAFLSISMEEEALVMLSSEFILSGSGETVDIFECIQVKMEYREREKERTVKKRSM